MTETKETKIQLTQDDLDQGSPTMLECCPFALALKRWAVFHGMVDPEPFVGRASASILDKTQEVFFNLSPEIQKVIDDIDLGREVHPAIFDVTYYVKERDQV